MSFDAYSVAVKLKLLDGVSSGLIALTSRFSLLNRHIVTSQAELGKFEARLKSIRATALSGGLMIGAGVAGASLFKAPIEEAAKFDQQVQKFKLFGLGDAVTAEAAKFAKGMNVIGTSYTDAMRDMVEAQGVFRESGLSGSVALNAAKLAAPWLAKLDFASRGLDDESRARMHTQGLDALRFIEQRGGLTSPARFKEEGEAAWKAIQTSGGNVNWSQLRQFMRTSGIVGQNMSDESLFGAFEPVVGEQKGQTAGYGLATAYNRISGAVRIPNQVAHMLVDNGIWDGSKVEWNKMGGIKRFLGNPLRDADLALTHPDRFYEKDVRPLWDRMGLSAPERARYNLLTFGRTGGTTYSLLDRQMEVSHRSIEAQKKALGLDASVGVAGQLLQGKQIDLEAKWKSLMAELGTTVLPVAITAIQGLTDAIKALTGAASDHPTVAKGLEYGVIGLSGLGLVAGTWRLVKAGAGVLGVGAAAAGLGAALPEIAVVGGAAALGYGAYRGIEALHDHFSSSHKPVAKVTVINKLDKRGLQSAVLGDVTRPQTGTSTFDPRMALPPPGH